jgi:hypothetical protein
MPGMAELMEGAIQQAPQPGRHFMSGFICYINDSYGGNKDEGLSVFVA